MNTLLRSCLILPAVLLLSISSGCCAPPPAESRAIAERESVDLLARGMEQWKPINFGGEGEVSFAEGTLKLDMGGPLTGVAYTGEITDLLGEDLQPYELSLQARRVEGIDFFCCLTFPVGTEGHVSLVLGGWAGSTVGISSLDGYDAASNKTTQYITFEDKQWYDIRVKVTAEKVECFLDEKQIIDVLRADYKTFSLRPEVELTAPLGICTFQTQSEVRNFTATRLD